MRTTTSPSPSVTFSDVGATITRPMRAGRKYSFQTSSHARAGTACAVTRAGPGSRPY